MKLLKLFFLFFPLVATSQERLDFIGEKLKQNKKYEYVYGFENNYAVFRTFNKKMGVIDSTESIIIKPIFSFIHNKKELKNLFEVGNEINKKFKRGFIDLKGNTKIPIIYDDVFYFEKGLIRVTKDSKVGVLDTLNNIILPIKFDYISTDNNRIIARYKGTNNLYDFRGKQITNLDFTKISYFKHDKAIIALQNKTYSVIDSKGNLLLKPIKDYSLEKILDDNLYLIKNNLNSKEGIINSKNEFIINCKYDEIEQVKSFFIAKNHNKKGIISSTDYLIKPFIYDEIFPNYFDSTITIEDNNLEKNFIVKKDNLYGVINPKIENEIIPIKYKSVFSVGRDDYYVTENDKKLNGVYNYNGRNIIPEEYKFYTIDNYKIFAERNKQSQILDVQNLNNTIYLKKDISFIETVRHYSWGESLFQIIKNQTKYGVINSKNEIVIPIIYDEIKSSENWRYFIIRQNDKIGLINTSGNIIKKPIYDDVELRKEYLLLKRKNMKDEIYSYEY